MSKLPVLPLGVTNKGISRYDVYDSMGKQISIQPTSSAAWAFVRGYYQALVDTDNLPKELSGILERSHYDAAYPRPSEDVRRRYQRS